MHLQIQNQQQSNKRKKAKMDRKERGGEEIICWLTITKLLQVTYIRTLQYKEVVDYLKQNNQFCSLNNILHTLFWGK